MKDKLTYSSITFLITLNVAIAAFICAVIMLCFKNWSGGIVMLGLVYTNYLIFRIIKSLLSIQQKIKETDDKIEELEKKKKEIEEKKVEKKKPVCISVKEKEFVIKEVR